MRATMLYGPRDVRVKERPDPQIIEPTDAIIRLPATCVCGSDLWPYRGVNPVTQPTPMGHEYVGIVEAAVVHVGWSPGAAGDEPQSTTAKRLKFWSNAEGDTPMATWTNDQLERIEAADELQIASVRGDGTLRKPVTIWVVRLGDDLYVRSVNGRAATWFHGAQDRHEAHIHAGGVDKDVTLVETDDPSDAVDTAYRTKYCRYSANIVNSVLTPQARAATLKLVPRS